MIKKRSETTLIVEFVGHCRRKKYETLAHQLSDKINQTFSSKVHYVNRVKKPSEKIEVSIE